MGVSAIGEGVRVSALKKGAATALVVLGLFYYLYGPPLTQTFRDAADERCNALTGSKFRGYALEWRTLTVGDVSVPHWQCTRLGRDPRVWDLGWWVSP